MQDHESWIAMVDQAKKGAKDLAETVATFYVGLVQHGVPKKHAVQIVTAWVMSIARGSGEA